MSDDLNPGPQYIPNERVSSHVPPGSFAPVGRSDRDNFVTDQVTILTGPPESQDDTTLGCGDIVVTVSPSASGRTPILTLDEIKLWVRIEEDQTIEDPLLMTLEMAAHLYTERYLRQTLDGDAPETIGENIKLAMLVLIAHWYRNREAVSTGSTMVGDPMPLGYAALLSGERDFPCMY